MVVLAALQQALCEWFSISKLYLVSRPMHTLSMLVAVVDVFIDPDSAADIRCESSILCAPTVSDKPYSGGY